MEKPAVGQNIGVATAGVARVRTLPTFGNLGIQQYNMDPPNIV